MLDNDKLLTKFKQHLLLEKALSQNTLEAYVHDVEKLFPFLEKRGITPMDAKLEDLENFLAELHDEKIGPRSQARILSGIRSFYRFLVLDGHIEADPTLPLESPKTGMKLPEVLSIDEIDMLINAIDLSDPRDEDTYEELSPLLGRIRSQNRQLRRQMEELRQQDAMRREFTANVSHELKTPLTGIVGTAEIMENGLVRPEDVSHFAGNIYREAKRLIGLVNDIIKLSRLEGGTPTAQWETVDLLRLADDIRDQLAFAAQKRQVDVQVRGVSARAQGVPRIVEEVLYNLCDNAVAYNRPGGSVTVTVEDTPAGSVVTVADTGIGIPRELQDRVFERFYRVDNSRSGGGTGLGLSIVKHGVAYLGAQIELESREGEGSTFTVRFPCDKIEA